jgi:hypothetical protein
MMMNKNNHSISKRQGIWAAFLLAFAFMLAQPARAQNQWVTNGNNINNTNTGNVGVGITTPFAKLDVMAAGGSTAGIFRGDISNGNEFSGQLYLYTSGLANTRVRIAFADSANGAGISQIESARYPGGGGYLSFITRLPGDGNMVERMRIDNSGNVGIGITNPTYRLDVQGGQINTSGGLCIAGDCKSSWSQVGVSSQWTTSGANILYNSGNVGIGTTNPTVKLEVLGGIYATGGTALIAFQDRISGRAWTWYGANDTARFGGTSGDIIGITPAGNVGIGTTTPTSRLHVVGNGRVTGNLTVDGNIAAKYQDIAEWVSARHTMPAGTVVVLDIERSNQVVASQTAYDTRVAGVVSDSPGVILGEGGQDKVMVATTGRVRVKVDATRAPIRVGDILVTSDREGIAMRSEPIDIGGAKIHRPGTIIGKALEPLDKGAGEILVLLSLQ